MTKLGLSVFCLFYFSIFLSSQKDWQVALSQDDITLWTKDFKGSNVKQFKLKTNIKCDIKTIYSVLKDVENMHLWYDRVASVNLLKKISENEGIYLLEYGLPFPFENRVATINGKINYDTLNNTIIVLTNYFPFNIPKQKSGLLPITEIQSSWNVIKKSDGIFEIIHSGYMNPGGNIPLWLSNEGVTSGPLKTIKAFKKMLLKHKNKVSK